MITRTIEARLQRLEAAQRDLFTSRMPPRVGLVVADDYPKLADLTAAVNYEVDVPGTIDVRILVFVDAIDGRANTL